MERIDVAGVTAVLVGRGLSEAAQVLGERAGRRRVAVLCQPGEPARLAENLAQGIRESGLEAPVRVLPDGPLHRISQALGEGSRGCRLDPGAIEQVSSEVEARIGGCDLLVINKFGKQESLGRGLRPAIAQAAVLGIPVLVGVNGLNLPDFMTFTAGAAKRLEPEPSAVLAWALESVEAARSMMA